MSFFTSAASSSSAAASQTQGDLKSDVALSDPPTDSISDLAFSPATTPNGTDFLAVASWDNKVRIYEINGQGQSQGKHAYEHAQPVLNCDFSKVSCL
jgi:mRNA export factor